MVTYVYKISLVLDDKHNYESLYNYLDSFADDYFAITKTSFIIATSLRVNDLKSQLVSKTTKTDKIYIFTLSKGFVTWHGLDDSEEAIQLILSKNTYK